MEQAKYIYLAFQSSQNFEPTSQELLSFQRKYKKNFETRELYEGEELQEQYRLRGWKSPRYSQIVSIILAFEHEGELKVRFITGSEIDLFTELNNVLRKSQDYILVNFESQIVLPYLGIRMARAGFINPVHSGLSYRKLRPWDLKSVDLQQYYDGAGNYKSSIKDIADDLHLNSEDIIEIEDEFVYYNTGDFEALKKSAIQKVEVMSQAHRLLLELPALQTVLVEEQVKDVVEERPLDWAKELFRTKKLTKEIKEGLIEQLKKKKMLKKDKEILHDILSSIYLNTEMFHKEKDTELTTEVKKQEIKELLDAIK